MDYLYPVSAVVGVLGVAAFLAWQTTEPGQTEESRDLDDLAVAEKRVEELRAKLGKKEVRIWMDGAFDMMHYGHVNAFRKGRALGTHLVVGVNDDESITRCKGPPVMNDGERLTMVKACKFVDEVVPKVPYVMDDEYVRWVIKEYNIDFVVHGDDPCIVDGRDVYESARALGKYRTIPRTEGVSTTEIVGRMLLLTSHHHASPSDVGGLSPSAAGHKLSSAVPDIADDGAAAGAAPEAAAPETDSASSLPASIASPSFVRESKFLTTSRMLRLFAAGCSEPPAGAKVVYVDGGWDMFHASHVQFLEKARALGDFLIVGVHNDVVVNRHRGANFPIMNTNERTLSVLSCKHVGDVVIDPPWHMTREMIAALNIAVVAHGSLNDPNDDAGTDPYEALVSRIQANHERMTAKIEKKKRTESEYYAARYGFGEPTETGPTPP